MNRYTLLGIFFLCSPFLAISQIVDLFVGTYTQQTKSEGIYWYSFDLETAEIHLKSTTKSNNPSFLARYENRLLTVNELDGGKGGVSLYEIEKGGLKLLDSASSFGDAPCHIELDNSGVNAMVSNYTGGSLVKYNLTNNRTKLQYQDSLSYEGSGVDKERQEKAHVHSAFYDASGNSYVSDLGTDRIYVVREYKKKGERLLMNADTIHTLKGGGPRHLTFNKLENTLYSLQELTGQIVVYQREQGKWNLKQVVPIYNDGFNGEHGGADIKSSPDGKYLYATNRGQANVIIQYEVLPNGLLEWKEQYSVQGKGPRNFNISPNGKFLLVANQLSDEVVIFSRNEFDGRLTDTGKRLRIPQPVCVIF